MGNTNWKKLSEMSDAEIHQNALEDPDAQPTTASDWKNAQWKSNPVESESTVTLRLTPKVLAFFQREGDLYDRKINAILEAYVDQAAQGKA